MIHYDIKELNDNVFKNFIATPEYPNLKIIYYFNKSESKHEEFFILNYYYKEKIDLEDEKKMLEKFAEQKF